MNIFFFTKNQKLNARLLDDKRLVKMVLETTQLLSNGLYLNNQKSPYKHTHLKHPCSIWSAKSKSNWQWLKKYGLELANEYTRRYGKIHKCEKIIRSMHFKHNDKNFYEPPQCMPDKYKCNKSSRAYIKYYTGEKFNEKYFKYTNKKVFLFWKKLVEKYNNLV
jgi:hypothetical protein